MPITVTSKDNDSAIYIKVIDRFDYSVHKEFRAAYQNTPISSEFIIDMSSATYIDSSALGMLLLLREHLGDDSRNKITIKGCNPEINKILNISNFNNLFSIT